jgi:hypothetical protein
MGFRVADGTYCNWDRWPAAQNKSSYRQIWQTLFDARGHAQYGRARTGSWLGRGPLAGCRDQRLAFTFLLLDFFLWFVLVLWFCWVFLWVQKHFQIWTNFKSKQFWNSNNFQILTIFNLNKFCIRTTFRFEQNSDLNKKRIWTKLRFE